MSKLLYIESSPMGDLSFSSRLARAFMDTYAGRHPEDVIDRVSLWDADLPPFDFTAASGKYKVMRGLPHSHAEATAWAKVVEQVNRLTAADKVVLSTGMWNFSIPYRLKQYIDNIAQPGLTFAVDPRKGYQGLVTGKPLQLLLAGGGEYPPGSPAAGMDYQKPYLEMIFGFMGFTDIRTLRVEGTLSPSGEENLKKAILAAQEAAAQF